MSEVITLFHLAAPVSALLALCVAALAAVVLLVRWGCRGMMRRPRVVTMARHRELVRQMEERRHGRR
ncbi:hypothetical protein [Rhodopseudomonas telluris]|uniref:Uncharacterized protein n=1 Tax=Rhodopseudomonas telluris TaxID=644215 RepID=A0ABV6EV83_9BRAD